MIFHFQNYILNIFDRNYERVVLCVVNTIYTFDFIAVVLSEKGGKVRQSVNVK